MTDIALIDRRSFLGAVGGLTLAGLSVLSAGCTTTGGASGDPAAQRQALNAQTDNALARLFREARDSEALVNQARGVLVIPRFLTAGFIIGAASAMALGTSLQCTCRSQGRIAFK